MNFIEMLFSGKTNQNKTKQNNTRRVGSREFIYHVENWGSYHANGLTYDELVGFLDKEYGKGSYSLHPRGCSCVARNNEARDNGYYEYDDPYARKCKDLV